MPRSLGVRTVERTKRRRGLCSSMTRCSASGAGAAAAAASSLTVPGAVSSSWGCAGVTGCSPSALLASSPPPANRSGSSSSSANTATKLVWHCTQQGQQASQLDHPGSPTAVATQCHECRQLSVPAVHALLGNADAASSLSAKREAPTIHPTCLKAKG
jgi:hypothetical protein